MCCNFCLQQPEKFFAEAGQTYNMYMYLALFSTAYFGLFRVGELTQNPHVVKAIDVQVGMNKRKFLFWLRSSKMHNKGNKPQSVKVSSSGRFRTLTFCPYNLLRNYLLCRPKYRSNDEQFFIFRDGSSVCPHHFRLTLKSMLAKAAFNPKNYSCHSLHGGRSLDLLALSLSVETIKKIG